MRAPWTGAALPAKQSEPAPPRRFCRVDFGRDSELRRPLRGNPPAVLAKFTPHQRGNAAMLMAMALFVANDALVKLATAAYPTGQVLAVRGVFASAVAFGLVFAFGQGGQLRALARRPVILRALMEGLIAFSFITALARLPLANITSILLFSSLFIIILAAALGIERVDLRRWLAVLVGFGGVLMIVRPSIGGFNAYSLIALLCALLVAARDLMTRRIAAEIPSAIIALGTTLGVTAYGFALAAIEPWQPLELRATLYLALAALVVALGNTGIIIAYRNGRVSTVSGLRYTVLVFALLGGLVVLGEWPDAPALLGAALIVGSGLYALNLSRSALDPAREAAS
jgi:drug/metabolite transporter (DMT)-like permease